MALPARSPLPGLLKLGRGRCFFNNINTTTQTIVPDHADMGDLTSLEFSLKDTREKVVGMMDPNGLTYDTGLSRREGEITIKGYEFSQENLVLLMMGTEAAFTQTGGTVTAETVTTALVLGAFYFLKQAPVTTLTDLKIGTTTLIVGLPGVGDYQVIDLKTGAVQINQTPSPTNSAVVIAGATLTADYTATAVVATTPQGQVNIGTVPYLETGMVFVPFNAKGIGQQITLFRVSWYPTSSWSPVSEKYAEWELKGDILADTAGLYGGSAANPWGYIRNTVAG